MDIDKLLTHLKEESKNSSESDKIKTTTNNLLAQLTRSDGQIKSMDTKLAVILAFVGVFGGFVIKVGPSFDLEQKLIAALLFITLLLISFSTFFSLLGLRSTLVNKNPGLWSQRDIAKNERYSIFSKRKKKQTVEEYQEDIIVHLYITAKLAVNKFEFYRVSLILLIASVFIFSLTVLIDTFN